jgi:hypothetical protein
MNDIDPVIQYIIIRNDLASMTPGRAAAQAAHAANHCVKYLRKYGSNVFVDEWEAETGNGFGTTIVLQASLPFIHLLRDSITDCRFHVITDPEYHLQDGEVTHLFPLETCMWIFGRKSMMPYVGHLELY